MLSNSVTQIIHQNSLVQYLLQLGDTAMILSHRNSEWCGHGPILEQDIALTNIALDQIGQARNFYQYAASIIQEQTGETITEDALAYLRDGWDFHNVLLAEIPNGDWAQTILRNFFLCSHQYYVYQALGNSSDEQLKAICNKSFKEVSYHLRWSGDWLLRLGDGTLESRDRICQAMDALWPYTGELIEPTDIERQFLNGSELSIRNAWEHKINEVLTEATIPISSNTWMQKGGKIGNHTEHLGYLLAEMQFIQRAYPGLEW